MKMYIPSIGDEIKLYKDWNFILYNEYRNKKLINSVTGQKFNRSNVKASWNVCLKKDTILRISRIYIRMGARDFDSISFIIMNGPDKNLNKKRFWAKLKDVNNIEFENFGEDKIKLTWKGYLVNIKNYRNLQIVSDNDTDAFSNNILYVANEKLTANVNDKVRFHIFMKTEKVDVNEDNWKKLDLDKYFNSLSEYEKHLSGGIIFKKAVKVKNLFKVVYVLKDLESNELYEFKSIQSCKNKAKKIMEQ